MIRKVVCFFLTVVWFNFVFPADKFKTFLIEDLPYADSNNPRQELDLILPKGTDENSSKPLVVWIHGGGWKSGNRKSGMRADRLLKVVESGKFIGASISYRLSGESKWPAQIYDCKAAIRWLRANASKFGIDSNKIAVWGSSAGGHLATMLGVTGGVKKLEGEIGSYEVQSSRIQAVINYYGPSSFLTMDDFPSKIDHNHPRSPESLLVGAPIQKRKKRARLASPVNYVTFDDCPHLLFHGKEDQLVPYNQSVILSRSLDRQKVPNALVSVHPGSHGMPPSFTDRFVLPFLLQQFFEIGEFPVDQTIRE